MQTRPGMNHKRVVLRSGPVCNQEPRSLEKNTINVMNTMLMEALINKEEEAMVVFSFSTSELLTYRMWAFFNSPLFVVSKMVVIVRKRVHVPICDFGR